MPVNHDAVAALPTSGAANKALLRNTITARMPYVLADADTPTDLVAVDPASGAAIIDIVYLGRLFHYDPTDMVTVNDGATCLVSYEGRRYKLSSGSDVFCYAVIDNTHAVPPASPSLGDAYLVAAAATGAWAGKSDQIAVRTARGWEFVNFGIGRFIYVEAVDTYYHRNTAGAWVSGLGPQTTPPATIPLSAAINFGKRLIVENQTTTAPPTSPAVGVAYIIGPSATGAWSGRDLDTAICEVAGQFTLSDPAIGWSAFDKATGQEYYFNGSAWIPTTGAWVSEKSVFTAAYVTAAFGSTYYTYSDSVAPTTSHYRANDTASLSYTARKSGAKLRFTYQADFVASGTGIAYVALFRDAVSNALAWQQLYMVAANIGDHFVFEIAAPDALSHTYYVAALHGSGGASINGIRRRLLAVQEASQ